MTTEIIKQYQKGASPQEKTIWKQWGAIEQEGLWRGPDRRIILPPGIREKALAEAHGAGHVGAGQMNRNLCHWWHPFLIDMTRNFVRRCSVCTLLNSTTVKTEMGVFPITTIPGQEIVIDYTDMVESVRGYRYVLMCVDTFTGRSEACPTKREDSTSVIKFLIDQYIPRHEFPEKR